MQYVDLLHKLAIQQHVVPIEVESQSNHNCGLQRLFVSSDVESQGWQQLCIAIVFVPSWDRTKKVNKLHCNGFSFHMEQSQSGHNLHSN